jgi:hypothetical protein
MFRAAEIAGAACTALGSWPGALTDFVAAAGGLLLGGFLVKDNSLTGKWGIMGLALLAAGIWFIRDGVKKLRT